MIAINQTQNLFIADAPNELPSDWEFVTVEEFNLLRAGGFSPKESLKQATRTVLDRLTPDEQQALSAARMQNYRVDMLVMKALATGAISEIDVDFPAARTALNALGIIASDRWPELLAP